MNGETMIPARFAGERGKRMLVEELQRQRLVAGTPGLAEALADAGSLEAVPKGQSLIEQGGDDTDVFFIVTGQFDVVVNKKIVARRLAGDEVGEMTAISPTQRRSATVLAAEDGLVLKVTDEAFSAIGTRFPDMYGRIARELARRLEQRNALVRQPNDKVRVFVISSAEALPVARAISNAFTHDPFLTVVWSEGVFKVTNYTLQNLEDELDRSDLAVAVTHGDDQAMVRGTTWPSPRDNVVFELGFFMGRLGRARAILMEPRDTKVKLPSDLAGVTTIADRFEAGNDAAALLAPACNELREHILKLGPNV